MAHDHLDVRHIANLARLKLSDEECATFTPQLEAILRHAEALRSLDLDGIESIAHPVAVLDVMRDDVPLPSLPQEAVLANAPDQAQQQIRVPKVIADA